MSNIERRLKNFEGNYFVLRAILVVLLLDTSYLILQNLGTLYLVLRTIHGTSYNYLIRDTSYLILKN